MEKQWISTIELLNYLKEHPNKEKECRLSLGYGLGSTHYWYWDPKTNMFMHSRDWDFEPYTASQVVNGTGKANGRLNNESSRNHGVASCWGTSQAGFIGRRNSSK